MKKLRFGCKGCGQTYTLGKDAAVVTTLGILSDAQMSTILGNGSSLVDNRGDPDLVASIERSWKSLAPSVIRDQEAEISRISKLLSKGKSRWWKCRKCGEVQTYQLM